MKNERKWVILVENYDSSRPFSPDNACDPAEVAYSLAEINEGGEILCREGSLQFRNHGWPERLKEALANGMFEKRMTKDATPAEYKAVKP